MRIPVKTPSHTYDVVIGQNILQSAVKELDEKIAKADQLIVFTDENVWKHQQDYFKKHFPYPFEVFVMPSGEASKSFENFQDAHTFLIEKKCTRKSLVFAFGGGAVGDVTGFVAATYMRGIPFVQIPTTILAHDSAVGGKTAINHPMGKNLIGAFYQPEAVIYDLAFLQSLNEREIRSGMAEVVKHAIISDEKWFYEILESPKFTTIETKDFAEYLQLGIQVKAKIVEQDETEQSVRKFLNFGHTYGHAIEAAAGYGSLTHGEAIMIGMVYAFLLCERYGNIKREFIENFVRFALKNDYPLHEVERYPFSQLKQYLVKDKKVEYGNLKFVLLKQLGEPYVETIDIQTCEEIDEQLRQLLKEVK